MCIRIWCLVGCLVAASSLSADEEADAKQAAREERLQAMRKIAERFTVEAGPPGMRRRVPLMESPVLRFNDPARDFHDASLWAWGERGRPACLLSIEQYGQNAMFEYISLSDQPLIANAQGLRWQPAAPGIAFQSIPGAAKPAKSAVRRLSQMKGLLGELTAHEIGKTGSRYELRLMTTPLHRYSDPAGEVQDGAIFAFAYGTNPELLAVVEARGKADAPQWRVGFARCGTAEPRVLQGEEELFHLPYARQTKPTDAYWNFSHRFAEE